jgi:hypothetical protein
MISPCGAGADARDGILKWGVRRIPRVAAIALLALAGLYAGDYLSARYGIPGHRQTLGSVQVQTLYAVRQKGNRIEYSLGDTVTQTCVRSLFPQMGYAPCWYLTGHATKTIDVGRAAPEERNPGHEVRNHYRAGMAGSLFPGPVRGWSGVNGGRTWQDVDAWERFLAAKAQHLPPAGSLQSVRGTFEAAASGGRHKTG